MQVSPKYRDIYNLVPESGSFLGDCQNYGPFLGPYYNTGDPKRDHNFDKLPFGNRIKGSSLGKNGAQATSSRSVNVMLLRGN